MSGCDPKIAARLESAEEEIARLWKRIGEGAPDMLGSSEAADYIGMSRRWVQLHADKLGGVMAGDKLLFPKSALDRYIESRKLDP